MKKSIKITFAVILAAVLAVSMCLSALAVEATFTMTGTKLEISAKDILEKGTVTTDDAKFNRDGHTIAASDNGMVFWHSGNGDTFTFTVDFGKTEVTVFTFNYGGPVMTLKLYADGKLVGEATTEEASRDVENHLCKIALSEALTGVKEIKVEELSETVVWPGTDFGYFTFYSERLVMDSKEWTVKSSDILSLGSVVGDPAKFDRAPREVAASDDRYYFWHSGNGDVYTFDVNFGDYQASSVSINYGGPAMTLKFTVDGKDLGSIDTEDCGRDVENHAQTLEFKEALTGKHTIGMEVISETTVWPGTDFGRVTFKGEEKPAEPDTPDTPDTPEPPQTSDGKLIVVSLAAMAAVPFAAAALIKRKVK